MCGRYSLVFEEFSELRLGVNLELFPHWTPKYNIAPSRAAGHEPLLVRSKGQAAEVAFARWWFIPYWWRQPLSKLPTTFNARSEELSRKPMWREAYERRRCLVPATGWREFAGPSGSKRAFHFRTREPFAFAGVWDEWVSPDGELIDSFAIITAGAGPLVRSIHDRMPVIVPKHLHAQWLFDDAARASVFDECVRQEEEDLEVYEVKSFGNSVHNEGPECIAPLGADSGTQASSSATPPLAEARQQKLF